MVYCAPNFFPEKSRNVIPIQTYTEIPNIKFDFNTSCGRRDDMCGQTDVRKEIGPLHDYVIAPKNDNIVCNFSYSILTATNITNFFTLSH
jgi:hypothetical protein